VADFVSWSDLAAQMRGDLASGSWRIASYMIEGQQTTYRTFDEFRRALEYAELRAAQETGAAVGRTYARQGGRG